MIFSRSSNSSVGGGSKPFFGNTQTTTAVGRNGQHASWAAANQRRVEEMDKAEGVTGQGHVVNARATALLTSRSSTDCKVAASQMQTTPAGKKACPTAPVRRIQMKLCRGKLVLPTLVSSKKKGKGNAKPSRGKGGRFNSAFTTASDDEDANGDDIRDDEERSEEEGELSDDFCDDRDEEDLTEGTDSGDEISRVSARELADVGSASEVDSEEEEEEEEEEEILRGEDLTDEESDSEWIAASDDEEEAKPENPDHAAPPAVVEIKLAEMPAVLEAFFKVVDNPTDHSLRSPSAQRAAIKVLEVNFVPYDDAESMREQFKLDFFASKPNATSAEEIAQFNRWHGVYAQMAKLATSINRNRRRQDARELRRIDKCNSRRYAILTGDVASEDDEEQQEVVDLTEQKPRWIETRPHKQQQQKVVVIPDAEPAQDLGDMQVGILCNLSQNYLFKNEQAPWSAFLKDLFMLFSCAEDEEAIGFASAGRVYGDEWWIVTNGKGTRDHPLTAMEGSPNPGRAVRVPDDLDPCVLRLIARALRVRSAAVLLHGKAPAEPVKVMGWFSGPRKDIRARQAVTLIACPDWMDGMLQRTGNQHERDFSEPTNEQVCKAIAALSDS